MDNLKRNAKENTSMDHSVDSAAESSVDRKLQEIFGLTDEMLLAEFEAAEKDTRGLPIPPPPADEFETIWSRIQEDASNAEKEKAPIIRVRFNWRRLAAIGLIACLMAGGLCFVAVGKKSYFYREKMLGGDADNTVLVNDDYKADVNGEEKAYEAIEKELGIIPLKLGYIPAGMKFRDFELRDGYAKIGFEYRDQVVYFIQSKYEKAASYSSAKTIISNIDTQIGYYEASNDKLGNMIQSLREKEKDGVKENETKTLDELLVVAEKTKDKMQKAVDAFNQQKSDEKK